MKICPRCSEVCPDEADRCPKDDAVLMDLQDPLLGKTISGRYRLISRLGSGGMSSVYLARHVMIDRLIAIKTLRRELARDAVQRDRFIREARAVNRINHENIVEITDFGETDDGLIYLVMEYVAGDPLYRVMMQGPMEPTRALLLARQATAALARAHQMGVIHRDLKPENILLTPLGNGERVKILDFGIAKILDAPALTGSQQLFGTPGYIAPEYIQSSQIDGRSDLYSLGVILYELITGALPFDYEYPGDLLVKHVTEPPIPPRQRLWSVHPEVEQLILKALEKDPNKRFRDAYQFAEAIDHALETLGADRSLSAIGRPTMPAPEEAGNTTSTEDLDDDGPTQRFDVVGEEDDRTDPDLTWAKSAAESSDRDGHVGLPPTTREYGRLSIPVAPTPDVIAVDGVASVSRRAKPSDPPAAGDGLGVSRWRRRFDVIRAYLDEVAQRTTVPAEVEQAMARAADALEALEEGVGEARRREVELESLRERARALRSEAGRTIDELGQQLSHARSELENLAARRTDLQTQRELSHKREREGGRDAATADREMWELAAAEEALRSQGARCDELELQLSEHQQRLNSDNDTLDVELAEHLRGLEALLGRLEHVAAELPAPLEAAEAYVVRAWDAE